MARDDQEHRSQRFITQISDQQLHVDILVSVVHLGGKHGTEIVQTVDMYLCPCLKAIQVCAI